MSELSSLRFCWNHCFVFADKLVSLPINSDDDGIQFHATHAQCKNLVSVDNANKYIVIWKDMYL